jgi:hypothetical protein
VRCATPKSVRSVGTVVIALVLVAAGAHIVDAASTGPNYRRTLTFYGGYGSGNGCASESVNDVGSDIRYGATTFSRTASGTSCDTLKDVPSGYLHVYMEMYKAGAYCGGWEQVNSGTTSGLTVFRTCPQSPGTVWYQTTWNGGWQSSTGLISGPWHALSAQFTM